MGNISLAAVLYGNGVGSAGIMAVILNDLVVFPVLRIQAKFYGSKMAVYILVVFLSVLVASALIMHYGIGATGMLQDASSAKNMIDREFFSLSTTR